ncbi:hypothetical protein U0070_015420, partial [Myodes glareolus]
RQGTRRTSWTTELGQLSSPQVRLQWAGPGRRRVARGGAARSVPPLQPRPRRSCRRGGAGPGAPARTRRPSDIKMSDDASDIIANEIREDAAEMPQGDSPVEDAEVQCGPATTSDEPVSADHTGEQHETTAACAETAPTGLLEQAKVSDAEEAPLNGEVTEDTLAECIDSNHDSHQLLGMACMPGALLASPRAARFTPCSGSKLDRKSVITCHLPGNQKQSSLGAPPRSACTCPSV